MKVRLKHIQSLGNTKGKLAFQFHEGPIKTRVPQSAGSGPPLFQFHEGPIKTPKTYQAIFRVKKFQFHEGPIKTAQAENMRKQNSVSIP